MTGRQDRDAVTALFQRAVEAYRAGRTREAEAQLERVVAADGRRRDALYLLGLIAYADGRLERAVAELRDSLEGSRRHPERHAALGAALLAARQPQAAVASFRRAIALRPADSDAHSNLGEALRRIGAAPEAEASLRRAIALDAANALAHYNLGGLLAETGRETEAAACLARAADLAPGDAEVQSNLGAALHAIGRADEAISSFRRAVALAPDNALLHMHLAHALLEHGDLEEGWRENEWRFAAWPRNRARDFPQPRWQGEPLQGRTLLVWMEQGIGDELMFAGLIPEIVSRAARCVVECAPKLVGLFRRSFPAAEVVPRMDPPDARTVATQLQVSAGTAARWLRPTATSFPAHAGYLCAEPARVAHWRRRLAALGSGLVVGFAWRSKDLSGTRYLTCARLEQWEPIFRTPAARFLCLQYDECAAELAAARARFGVELHAFPEVDLFNDLDEAAALTAAVDLVISAPTAVSDLAAALGVDTWQMTYGPNWKTLGTGRTPWYPSLTRFSRASGQSWEDVAQAVAAKLAERAA
jgi:Flp pilus assembly protein TadD